MSYPPYTQKRGFRRSMRKNVIYVDSASSQFLSWKQLFKCDSNDWPGFLAGTHDLKNPASGGHTIGRPFFSSSLCMCLKYETAREGVRHVTLVSEAWERKQNSRRPSSSRRSVQQVLRWMFSKRHLPPRINRTQLIFFCVLAGSWGQSVPQEIKLGKEKENICAAANVWHGAKLCAVSCSLSLCRRINRKCVVVPKWEEIVSFLKFPLLFFSPPNWRMVRCDLHQQTRSCVYFSVSL